VFAAYWSGNGANTCSSPAIRVQIISLGPRDSKTFNLMFEMLKSIKGVRSIILANPTRLCEPLAHSLRPSSVFNQPELAEMHNILPNWVTSGQVPCQGSPDLVFLLRPPLFELAQPVLFRAARSGQTWPDHLSRAATQIKSCSHLAQFGHKNRV